MDFDETVDTILGFVMLCAAVTGVGMLVMMAVTLNLLTITTGDWILVPLTIFVDLVVIASGMMIAKIIIDELR